MNPFPDMPGVYDHLIVHCSATPASLDVGTDWIDRVHRRQGWSGCGYHLIIRRDDSIECQTNGHRTRHFGLPGSHVGGCGPGWNTRSLGICLIGGTKEDGKTPEENFTDGQYATLWQMIEYACEAFGIPRKNVMGHRDLIKITNAAPKACPCFSVNEFLSGWQMPLDVYDNDRLSYDWDKKLRPPPQRNEKLVVRHQHIVKQGDTLFSISRLTGVPLKDIRRLNGLTSDTIRPGQKLRLLS